MAAQNAVRGAEPWDPRPRLRALTPVILDGEPYWYARDVMRAFRCRTDTTLRLVPMTSKRYVVTRGRVGLLRHCLIDRKGVRAVALRHGRVPLHEIMNELRCGSD